MIFNNKYIPIHQAIILIEKYIYEKKGVRVNITDINPVYKFEKAANIALTYYGY